MGIWDAILSRLKCDLKVLMDLGGILREKWLARSGVCIQLGGKFERIKAVC